MQNIEAIRGGGHCFSSFKEIVTPKFGPENVLFHLAKWQKWHFEW